MQKRNIRALLILACVAGLNLIPSLSSSTNTQGFLSVEGTSIVDSEGGAVILRGVNYPGYEYGARDVKLHKESAYATFRSFGFNVVRLPISWGNLEPSRNVFNEPYLRDYVDRDIRWAKKYGLYVVLDMHQTSWAERFGGNGVPDWTVSQYPPTEFGMRNAISHFWNDTEVQDHLIAVWTKIASRYVNEPAVVGFDILNEPWIYNSIIPELDSSHVNAFYVRVIKSIRTVDASHLIFLEPANMLNYTFPLEEKIVWSPHFYTLAYARHYYPSNASLLEADIAAKYQKFVVGMRSPMWIGEFGAFMKDGSSDQWLRDAVNGFKSYQIGWAWWAFSYKGRYATLPKALRMTAFDPTNVSQVTTSPPTLARTVTTFTPVQPMTNSPTVIGDSAAVFLVAFGFVIALAASLRHRRK